MRNFTREFGLGLLLALPVLAAAGLGIREVLTLRHENRQLEAQRLEAVGAAERTEDQLEAVHRLADQTRSARMRAVADASESQGLADEKLTRVIDFLKNEVSTAETTIRGLKGQRSHTTAAEPSERVAALLREVSRLNAEIETLREDRDRWKKAAGQ